MKYVSVKRFLYFVAVALLFTFSNIPSAWSLGMRITMSDGRTIDAPYFWEEAGQIKFEVPGGIAGVPKEQVTSIQEIVEAKEFDPEVLVENPNSAPYAVATKTPSSSDLKTLIVSKLPSKASYEKLNPEEGVRELKVHNLTTKSYFNSKTGNYTPLFNQEGEFNELVRLPGEGVMLVMRNVVSSQANLEAYNVSLILYDGEGNVLQKKPCEVSYLNIDPKELRKAGVQNKLYSLVATIRPDSKIKRYEISAMQR